MNALQETGGLRNGVADNPQSRKCFRVLVVDDNEIDREIVIRHLGEVWPFEHELALVHAGSAGEALGKLEQMRFTFVVLDWHLTQSSGAEVLRGLRERGIQTPVVVISGDGREEISENIESLGAGFLSKDNLSPVTFRDAIQSSLSLLGVTSQANYNEA